MIPLRIVRTLQKIVFIDIICLLVIKKYGKLNKEQYLFYFLIASYLVGSISSAIIICKIFSLPDPRTEGSKNPGATNVLRIGGRKLAAFVLFFDGLKGAMPVVIGHYLEFSLIELTVILLCSFLGHVFPIYYNFLTTK